jgi:hypothetical protein
MELGGLYATLRGLLVQDEAARAMYTGQDTLGRGMRVEADRVLDGWLDGGCVGGMNHGWAGWMGIHQLSIRGGVEQSERSIAVAVLLKQTLKASER